MDAPQPYVLEKCSLLEFIQHVIDNHTTTSWLVVCSTKQAFEERLTAELASADTAMVDVTIDAPLTMRTLAACSTLRIAFVSDLVHLRAFLASVKHVDSDRVRTSILAVLDTIELHRHTPSFSAQGLNRTFALAVDVACALSSSLVLHESPTVPSEADEQVPDPWDLDVGIVDIHTKTFGPGSRGWVGRTVKLRHVADRWLLFKQIERYD